jgi:hypothetical protein
MEEEAQCVRPWEEGPGALSMYTELEFFHSCRTNCLASLGRDHVGYASMVSLDKTALN